MATLTITITAGNEAGGTLRRCAKQLEKAAAILPDRNSTGASTVLTIDNAPATGTASFQVSSGPVTSAVFTA